MQMQPQREIKIGDVLQIMYRWRWFISGVTLAFVALGGVWTFTRTPVYKSTASVVVEREEAGTMERAGNYFLIPEYYQTHFELLKSQGVLEQAARRLDLVHRPEFLPRPSRLGEAIWNVMPHSIQDLLHDVASEQSLEVISEAEGGQRIDPRILRAFEHNVDVKPIRGTRLAYISVESIDPSFASQAANAIAASYIDNWSKVSARSKEKAGEWYSGQLERLRKKVEDAEQGLYAYRIKHGLVDAQEGQRDTAHKLAELNSELIRAEMKLVEAQSRYQHLAPIVNDGDKSKSLNWKMIDSSAEVLGSSLIQALRAQEIKASGQIAELTDKYGPLHPKLAHAISELNDLRERIQGEVEKVYNSLKHEYELAQARVRVVKEAVNRQKQEKTKLEQHEIEYGILDREAKSTRLLYEMFLKQMKDRELSPETQYTPVYLADPAVPPSVPIRPRKKLDLMIATMLGLISSIGLAVFFESRDARLKNSQEVERHHPTLPVLGIVPRLTRAEVQQLRIADANGSRMAVESFRALRTSLLLSVQPRPHSILVTSAVESEGKTTVAANLASAMAQLEQLHVVLIDGDLRKSQSHTLFEVATGNGPAKGLYDFLAGQAGLDDIIHQSVIPNLMVIPQGRHASNPSDLIHSRQMGMLLNHCLEQGWQVIIDAPPVLPVAEALILASMVEGVLFVISACETTRDASRVAVHRLTSNGAKLLGLVIQKAPPQELTAYFASNGNDHQLDSKAVGLLERLP